MRMLVPVRLAFLLLVVIALPLSCGGGGGGGGDPAGGAPAAAVQPQLPAPPPQLTLVPFAAGFVAPIGMDAPNDGTGRLFVIEQGGTIRIFQNGSVLATPFLDVTALVESGGEEGLLGLAFHPAFATNGRFFINYTRRAVGQLQSVISEFTVAGNPNLADPASERQLIVLNQPFDNHNGGQLAFGPDGFLYIAFGDGGSGGDPLGNGQSLGTLLGKILRVDVNPPFAPGKQYAIPADNPFAGGGGLPEIWAYGLRNPWRFSFDAFTGRLFAGDVGQGSWEEVDIITRGGNFGWNIMEGNHCFPPGAACSVAGLIPPIVEYDHGPTGGTSVIGGFVYRGAVIPGLAGTYVYGDLSSGRVWGLQEDSIGVWHPTVILTHNRTVSSFGRDAAGELYMIDYGNGAILRLAAAP